MRALRRVAAASRRPSWRRALAAALLALLALAAAMRPAVPAQAVATPWTATLAVQQEGSLFGCSECSDASVLTDDDFEYERARYSVDGLYWRPSDNSLILIVRRGGKLLTGAEAKRDLGWLVLWVDGRPLVVSRAWTDRTLLGWSFDPPRDWAAGQRVSLRLTTPPTPSKPTGLTAWPGDGQVRLTWSNPGDASVTGYRVYWSRDGDTVVKPTGLVGTIADIPGGGASTTTHTVRGLRNGAAYEFYLYAVNAFGRSHPSDGARATPQARPSAGAPIRGLQATPGDGQVTLRWDNPNGYVRDISPRLIGPREYRFEYRKRAGSGPFGAWGAWGAWTGVTVNRDGVLNRSPYDIAVVTGLANGTPYSFEVRGTSDVFHLSARAVSATPRASVAPVRVAPGPEPGQLTVAWTAVPAATRNSHAGWGGYCIGWKTGAQGWDVSEQRTCVGHTSTRVVLRYLEAGTRYTVRMWWNSNMRHGDQLELLGEATGTPPGAAPRAPAAQSVAPGWALIPKDGNGNPLFGAGQRFRLLFVTSTGRDARSFRIADYNTHVQSAARGNAALAPFGGRFRALVSTPTVHARDNTATTGAGVPVYWLGGAKVADDYADLYDGGWDSGAARLESGAAYSGADDFVWTGSKADGTRSDHDAAGNKRARSQGNSGVTCGRARDTASPVESGRWCPSRDARPLYALSPVLTVAAAGAPAQAPALEWARVRGAELALRFDRGLDESSAPGAAAFAVRVAGAARTVSAVSVHQDTVTLTLSPAVAARDAVTVGYAPPARGPRLRGSMAVAAFSGRAVVNDTPSPAAVVAGSGHVWVAPGWPLIPAGLTGGQSFRLLFVTSTERDAASSDIADYNAFVQSAANRNPVLRPFRGRFRALISTIHVDARDNTGTRGGGPPIYWLYGTKAADDYADFYDGSWDSNLGKTESGGTVPGVSEVYTGSNADGTKSLGNEAGIIGSVKVGYANTGSGGSEISGPTGSGSQRFYALSPIITVTGDPDSPAVSLVLGTERIAESGSDSATTVKATLLRAVEAATTVTLSASPEGRVRLGATTLTVPAGATESPAAAVTAVSDDVDNPAENENVTLSGTLAGEAANPLLPVTLWVTDDDTRGVTVVPVSLSLAEGASARYTVTLHSEPLADVVVTPRSGDTGAVTVRTAATDDTLTFTPSNWATPQPVTVAAVEDADFYGESVTVTHAIRGGGYGSERVDGVTVTVDDDEVSPLVAQSVAPGWPLIPKDSGNNALFTTGQSFRLLFVTSTLRKADSRNIADYNTHVQNAANGNAALRPFKGQFRALVSTTAVHARQNTGTIGAGVPVYWLGGAKVADDYADFYDGSWDSGAGKTETGSAYTGKVWTGSHADGTRDRPVGGTPSDPKATLGDVGSIATDARDRVEGHALYALSPVLTVASGGEAPRALAPGLEWARVRGAELALRFDAALDESPAPAASAFAVRVAGAARTVSAVAVRQDLVTLTLGAAVTAGEAVTVGYTPPASGRLRRAGAGPAVAAFSGQAVTNDTPSSEEQRQSPPEAVAALTASVASAPAEHRGKGRFHVRIAFSEAVTVRAKDAAATMRVTGGTLARAARVEKRADLWELRIEPAGHEAVTLTLPATADCAAPGAVCTPDGRRLERPLSVTVKGPPALSVADARAREGSDATIDFAVTLSRAASGEVTVRYATRDGTAKKGEDYRQAKGTLVFAAGETAKTLSVALLDDLVDEGEETFTLVLKSAKGAAIVDGEATGTIENDDPMPAAWLARFGRAVAGQAVDAVTARLEGGGGSQVTLGGQSLSLDTPEGQAQAAADIEAVAAALGAGPDGADGTDGTWSRERWMRGEDREVSSQAMTGRELLLGSAFHLQSGGEAGGPGFAAWGRVAHGSFDGDEDGVTMNGEVTTGFLGADVASGRWLAGAAVARSEGEGTFGLSGGAARESAFGDGKIESSLTSVLPYALLQLSDRVTAWGMAGYGTGELTLTEKGGTGTKRYEADLTMTLGAVGGRGTLLVPAPEGGSFALALKTDAFWVRTESDATQGMAEAKGDATRLRLILDASRPVALGGGTLTPSLEVGLRHDGGDAETGAGVELGAGLGWADPESGVSAELRGRWLAAHESSGYEEWGVSGSLRVDPGERGRGLSLTLAPTVGNAASGAGNLWSAADARGLAPGTEFEAGRRLDAEVGYGVAGPLRLGTATPYAGLGLAEAGTRAWRAGVRWQVAPEVSLDLEGTRSESANDNAPEQGVMLRGALRW